jgi:hypothetical protein
VTTARVVGLHWCYDSAPEPPRNKNLELAGHVGLVASTEALCGPPPAAWTTLKGRLDSLSAALASNTLHRRLTDQVLHGGDTLDVGALLALAVAEKAVNVRASIVEDIHREVLAALHQAYQPHAARRSAAADKFDKTARRFTELVAVCDPEIDAATALGLDARAQAAYKAAPGVAAELDALIPALSAAALLSNAAPANPAESLEIPLTIDPAGCHRRTIWLGWHQLRQTREPSAVWTLASMTSAEEPVNARCGRWSGLLAAGATLRAHRNPAELELYAPPPPFQTQQVTPPGGTADNPRKPIRQRFDPCDLEYEQARPRGAKAALAWLRRRHDIPENDVDVLSTFIADEQEVPDAQD